MKSILKLPTVFVKRVWPKGLLIFKKASPILLISLILTTSCKTSEVMNRNSKTDTVTLEEHEFNAIFIGINKVDIFKIKGMEFHHTFLIIVMRNPEALDEQFDIRSEKFYNTISREVPKSEVRFFRRANDSESALWETTISASSACAFDTTAKALGNLMKVPNHDRPGNDKSGDRILVRKIASNDLTSIERILEFEQAYNDTKKYALLPEIKKQGFNSNSYTKGALEYAGLSRHFEIPSCYKAPGASKALKIKKSSI